MTLAEELAVRSVAQSPTKVAVCAETVLSQTGKEKYWRMPERIKQKFLKTVGDSQSEETEEPFIMEEITDNKKVTVNKTYHMSIRPNPFRESTTITYQFPFDTQYGEILIIGILGNVIDKFEINYIGKGQIEYLNEKLRPGVYFCQYRKAGKTLVTKKLIVTK